MQVDSCAYSTARYIELRKCGW